MITLPAYLSKGRISDSIYLIGYKQNPSAIPEGFPGAWCKIGAAVTPCVLGNDNGEAITGAWLLLRSMEIAAPWN